MHGCGHSSDLSLTIAESSVLRPQGMFKESDDVLKRAIGKLSPDSNHKIYMLGNFNLSLAENAIIQNDYKLAEDRIMQADLSELVVDAQGRLYRFTGNFEKAKVALEPCLRYFEHLPKDKIHYVVRQLADVLIELGNPEEAMALLQKHLSKLHAQGKMDTIAYNRLSLSFADAEILLGQHEAAQTRLEKVKHWFDLHSPANPTEQLDHVRALIASMRIAVRDIECGKWSKSTLRKLYIWLVNTHHFHRIITTRATFTKRASLVTPKLPACTSSGPPVTLKLSALNLKVPSLTPKWLSLTSGVQMRTFVRSRDVLKVTAISCRALEHMTVCHGAKAY
ncbi:hypothetical protein LTR95_005633 [Oleoguttula sp. CCFEE 5521]